MPQSGLLQRTSRIGTRSPHWNHASENQKKRKALIPSVGFPTIAGFVEAESRKRGIYTKLKPLITAQATLVRVNEKFIGHYYVENTQNWLITTNHDDALLIEADDRRFWVHRVCTEAPQGANYFKRYHSWLEAGGGEAVFGWLMRRDISQFDPMATPPMTAAKRTMLDASMPAAVRWVREQLRVGAVFADRALLTANEIKAAATWEHGAPCEVEDKHATAALRGEGFQTVRRVRLGENDTPMLWARNKPDLWRQLSAEKLREHYTTEKSKGRAAA